MVCCALASGSCTHSLCPPLASLSCKTHIPPLLALALGYDRLSRPYSASPYPLPDVGRRPVSAPYDPSYPSGPPQGARLPHMYDYSMSPDVSKGGARPGDLGGPGFGGYPDPLRSEIGEWQALSPEQYGGGMGYERGVGVQYGPDGMMAPMADAAMQSDGGEV